jgi:hypothetical protein
MLTLRPARSLNPVAVMDSDNSGDEIDEDDEPVVHRRAKKNVVEEDSDE